MKKEKEPSLTVDRLASVVSMKLNLPKSHVAEVSKEIIEQISESLANGNRVSFRGLGSFVVKQRNARKARNPQTGEIIQVKKKRVVRFKPSLEMKRRIA